MLCLRPERYFRGKIKGFMEDLGGVGGGGVIREWIGRKEGIRMKL